MMNLIHLWNYRMGNFYYTSCLLEKDRRKSDENYYNYIYKKT